MIGTRGTRARAGLRQLLRLGNVTPASVLACPDLVGLAASAYATEEDAAVHVSAAIERAIARLQDSEAATLLFAPDSPGIKQPLGERRKAAAALAGVTADSFRVRRERRIVDELARELLVELSQRSSATVSADKEVRCPFCGRAIRLGDCPIVMTGGENAPRAEEPRSLVEVLDSVDVEPELAEEAQGITSSIDGKWRIVVAPPTGEGPLASPDEAAERNGYQAIRPARACPACFHPLPRTIDTDLHYTVVFLGPGSSTKTSTLVSIAEHEAEGGVPFAVRHKRATRWAYVLETEEAREHLEAREPGIFAKFRAREPLQRTPAGRHHPPLEFKVTVERDLQMGLHFVDLSGEDYGREVRPGRARALRWADAIVFFVDPAPTFDPEHADPGSEVGGAGALLRGVIDDLRGSDTDPHLFVVVSKADLIGGGLTREMVDDAASYPPQHVQQVLRDCRAANVIGAAKAWPGGEDHVHWHFLAPMPPDDKPWGIKSLMDEILSSLPLKR